MYLSQYGKVTTKNLSPNWQDDTKKPVTKVAKVANDSINLSN